MTAVFAALYGLGLAASLAFLALHRPRNWARTEAVNAAGWVLVVPLVFGRSLVLVLLRGVQHHGAGDLAFSIGTLAVIDLLVLLRLWSWARFLRSE